MRSERVDLKDAPLLGLFILWIISCFIAFYALGDAPLRDFDEGTVARVSYELSLKNGINQFFPTIWGNYYLNKPPGLHWIISKIIILNQYISHQNKLPSEFIVRAAPAFISTLIVPLGGLMQWKLRPRDSISSICTSAILLTLLPIARHGRLAMLDGTQLTSMALFWLCLISLENNSKDKNKVFFAGIVGSFMLLLKAPLIIPTIIASLFPLLFGRYKLNLNLLKYFLFGLIPGFSWHIWNFFKRGSDALWLWWGDGAGRVLFSTPYEGSDLRFIGPIIELIEGGWPWLILFPFGIYIAWKERNTNYGRWSLGILIVMSLAILPLRTQLPWYSHPLWLPFSLLCGPQLALIVNRNKSIENKQPWLNLLPYIWIILGIVIITIAVLGLLEVIEGIENYLGIALCIGPFWILGGFYLSRRAKNIRLIGLLSMTLGNIFGLLILMGSSFWLWELNESFEVKPIAEMIKKSDANDILIYNLYQRPSLSWYSESRIINTETLPENGWVLYDSSNTPRSSLKEKNCLNINNSKEWTLARCGLDN